MKKNVLERLTSILKAKSRKIKKVNRATIVLQKDKSKPYRSIYFKKEYDNAYKI